eukprot:891668-Amphidinium_carterae.1
MYINHHYQHHAVRRRAANEVRALHFSEYRYAETLAPSFIPMLHSRVASLSYMCMALSKFSNMCNQVPYTFGVYGTQIVCPVGNAVL